MAVAVLPLRLSAEARWNNSRSPRAWTLLVRAHAPTQAHRQLRILTEIARLATENHPLERFLDLAVVQVARATNIDHVKILRYRRATADLLMQAGIGWKEGVVGTATFSTDLRSPPGLSFQTGEAVTIESVEDSPDFDHSMILKQHGIVAVANVPILLDGAAWGVLEVDSTEACDFRAEMIELLTAASAVISTAVRRDADRATNTDATAAFTSRVQAQKVLLEEMQHRVKNNFQIILASVALQQRRLSGEEVQRALSHVANRIHAISLAHDQLGPREDQQVVALAGYLRALCTSIEQQAEHVSVDFQADDVELSIDRAVPLGLILNEAATNSVKHAFGGNRGVITVRLQSGIGYGEARLTVADDGRGFEKISRVGSGLKLISSRPARSAAKSIKRAVRKVAPAPLSPSPSSAEFPGIEAPGREFSATPALARGAVECRHHLPAAGKL